MALTSEQAIKRIGGFGWYQLRMCLIISYSLVFTSMVLMVMTFSTAEPPWRCAANSIACTLNGTFKVGDSHYEKRCGIPRQDWEFAAEGDFDSIVTEWDLVCDTAAYVSLVNSLLFILWIFGAMLGSIVSDKYGRKIVLFTFTMLTCSSGLASAFAQAYWVFALFRGLVGVGLGGCVICTFVLALEYVGKKQRAPVGISIWMAWTVSMLLLVLFAYLIQNWRTLSIITSAPGLLFFLFWRFVPESLRWLLAKGRNKEACNILKAAAKTNNKVISDEELRLLIDENKQSTERFGDVRDLFANRSVTHRTLVSWYCWTVCAMFFYVIILISVSIGGNMYLNFLITSLVDLFGFISIPILMWVGRKKAIAFSLWMAGLSGIVSALLSYYDNGSKGYEAGKILMAMVLGKISITIAFDIVYVYSAELFPTVVRNTAMGTSTSAARIGSACAPYIVFSQRVHPLMPFGIMAINALICGILCMTLPETKDKAMTDTIKQVDMISQGSGIEAGNGDSPETDGGKTKLIPICATLETTA